MVYRPEEVANKVQRLLSDVETEVVEYKSAKNNFDFDDLGKYFSALSNEANLRHADAGWLLFGVRNDRTICGTGYRKEAHEPSVGLRKLKHEVALYTNSGMTFEEIYELTIERQRVVVFQIPPCIIRYAYYLERRSLFSRERIHCADACFQADCNLFPSKT